MLSSKFLLEEISFFVSGFFTTLFIGVSITELDLIVLTGFY